ncbi:MAG: N(4)-(beta-N-acetylglucosaminyl)-L-asparaginase [Bacteroidia bacterium]|nr:N(4)-(beta-N-acetylglucosaminyl)-L-asparaginase [Bacteroidia bacterium]
MLNRRKFNKYFPALLGTPLLLSCDDKPAAQSSAGPLIISTWANTNANTIAQQHLLKNDSALLDAIEKGVNSVEEDPNDTSVGYGGMPDNSGEVTLDACIMDKNGNAGSVTYLKNIINAVSVARKVMDNSPHVILSGEGANRFAREQGFEETDLLTDVSRTAYEKWKKKAIYKPEINIERHDTIGMIVKNKSGDLSGACSTSGLQFKTPGRVGDSPIIGSGLYVDNEVGAATATGLGEVILKSCSTFLVVELMRQGHSPDSACKEALLRIKKKYDINDLQVGLIAINKNGEYGGYAIQPGFVYAVSDAETTQVIDSKSIL